MHLAILTWWISTERAVALRSGANMRDWITIAGHTSDLYDFPTDLPDFLWKYSTYDLVIPMFHGVYGEDGQITAFLATLSCKYASSDFSVHVLCIDKNLTNLFLEDLDIKIPKTIFLRKWEDFEVKDVQFPAIVKPNHGWSSISTYKVWEHDELADACISLPENDDILIQECIEWREFTVAVYRDKTGYHTLPIMEIVNLENAFFDYEEKYETDGSNEVFVQWEEILQQTLSKESIRVAEYIGTRWVVRIDWRYDGRDIYFLEVNTIPGFTSGSFVPKMWKKAGKNEGDFVEILMI